MMTIKSMYHFESATRFNRFTEYLEKINWKIEKQLLKERVLKYNEDELYVDLQNQFNKNNLTIWPLKDEETITWMDTLLIMRRTMTSLFKKGISSDKLHIFMEYPLVYGNHMRADYLIVYDRLIIVLEFGMFNQDEKRSEERYTKKLQDSITHRQVLANMMNDGVKTVNYVMIYRPEYDRIKNIDIKENVIYNNQEIDLLTNFISTHANEQDKLAAINQLELINIY
jgi:hypothetical protein